VLLPQLCYSSRDLAVIAVPNATPAADTIDAVVPLRRLGQQAVLRRFARTYRLSLGQLTLPPRKLGAQDGANVSVTTGPAPGDTSGRVAQSPVDQQTAG
jgi:hypothetical protein